MQIAFAFLLFVFGFALEGGVDSLTSKTNCARCDLSPSVFFTLARLKRLSALSRFNGKLLSIKPLFNIIGRRKSTKSACSWDADVISYPIFDVARRRNAFDCLLFALVCDKIFLFRLRFACGPAETIPMIVVDLLFICQSAFNSRCLNLKLLMRCAKSIKSFNIFAWERRHTKITQLWRWLRSQRVQSMKKTLRGLRYITIEAFCIQSHFFFLKFFHLEP